MRIAHLTFSLITLLATNSLAEPMPGDQLPPSAREQALGGSIPSMCDNLDAIFCNPAGIGGLNADTSNKSWFRKLYYPHVTASSNENLYKTINDIRKVNAGTDSEAGRMVVADNAGKRQYGRANFFAGGIVRRFAVVGFSDAQVSAIPRVDDSNIIDYKYLSLSGGGIGGSYQSSNNMFNVGYFGYYADLKTSSNLISYDSVIDNVLRQENLKDNAQLFNGFGHNIGVGIRPSKSLEPSIGISATNVGDTTFKRDGEELEGEVSEVKIKQKVNASYSVSPYLGKKLSKYIKLTPLIAASDLTNDGLEIRHKVSYGIELAIAGEGSFASLSLRYGRNLGGSSYGALLNGGLIGLEISNGYSIIDRHAATIEYEKRLVGSVFVNLAEF